MGKLNASLLSVGYAWWLPCREYSRESGRNDGNFTVKKTWQLIPQPGQYQQWWIILMVWTLDMMWTSPLWSSFRKPTTPVLLWEKHQTNPNYSELEKKCLTQCNKVWIWKQIYYPISDKDRMTKSFSLLLEFN